MLFSVLINRVLVNLSCVWIWFLWTSGNTESKRHTPYRCQTAQPGITMIQQTLRSSLIILPVTRASSNPAELQTAPLNNGCILSPIKPSFPATGVADGNSPNMHVAHVTVTGHNPAGTRTNARGRTSAPCTTPRHHCLRASGRGSRQTLCGPIRSINEMPMACGGCRLLHACTEGEQFLLQGTGSRGGWLVVVRSRCNRSQMKTNQGAAIVRSIRQIIVGHKIFASSQPTDPARLGGGGGGGMASAESVWFVFG